VEELGKLAVAIGYLLAGIGYLIEIISKYKPH